ncbi:MAG: YggS family pyridoxal phosphate-dependent enzyme [Hydrogenovibrio sp.]|nr:YggS family pyridoxal phosphate-dependent enzyme [Hydrogenovibrio sp.]
MTAHSTQLAERYRAVLERIRKADTQARVSLLAVSKTKPIEDINQLAELGQRAFGENYLQEALEKIEQRPDLEWHFIGPIQSNKTKPIAEHFNFVHSVDRFKIARRLSQQRPDTLPPLKILLEVNISGEDSKSGFSPQEVLDLAPEIAALPNLELRGLMAIPQRETDPEKQRAPFRQLRQLLEKLRDRLPNEQLDTLSMGMSADLEAAIEEGATIVRIGTDIFGARDYGQS